MGIRRFWLGMGTTLLLGAAGCGTSPGRAAGGAHYSHNKTASASAALPTSAAKASALLPQPTPKHPLKVLVIGDSLGEDLEYGLQDVAGSSGDLHIIPAAYGSSGLVNLSYYNWPQAFSRDLAEYHPQLVYVLFGGNDSLSFDQGNQTVVFGTSLWRQDYGARVNDIFTEAQQAHARVVWVGLPIMAQTSVLSNSRMQTLNALYASQTAKHPGDAAYISTWKLFQNVQSQFVEYMKDSAGELVMVRDPDGVHIAPPAGDELIASYAIYETEQLEHISLCLTGSDLWTQYPLHRCAAS